MDTTKTDLRSTWRNIPSRTKLRWVAVGFALVLETFLVGAIILDISQKEWANVVSKFVVVIELGLLGYAQYEDLKKQAPQIACTSEADINAFLQEFISQGSTVDIVSRRVAWAGRDGSMMQFLRVRASMKTDISIYVQEPSEITAELEGAGVDVYYHPGTMSVFPRFTLLNRDRPGGRRLAVATGAIPDHKITVFDEVHHPQIIATAVALIEAIQGGQRHD